MEVKASLNNIRIASRKVRLVTNLVKGMPATAAQAQLAFLVKKPAPMILKLLNSACANAKNNFSIEKDNLFVKKITVDEGPTLKRWMPRAQGRATPIMKRTCSVNLVLEELVPGKGKAKKVEKPEVVKPEEVLPEAEQKKEKPKEKPSIKAKGEKKAFNDGQNNRKPASRQSAKGIKKIFQRKSV